MKKYFIFLFSIFISSFVFAAPQAQNLSGAVSTATGGAGVATIEISDSAFLNPATIGLFPVKQVNLSYSSSRFLVGLVDHGREALFPAALAYEQIRNDSFKSTNYHLVVAYPFGKWLSFGGHFHYQDLRFLNSNDSHTQTLADLGMYYQMTKSWSFGLVHKDIALTDTDLADTIDKVTQTTFGMAYLYDVFAQFRFDIETIENASSGRLIYKVGLETYVNEWIITRFGYRNDNIASQNFTTLGVGFAGPQFGLHYAYQTEANNTVDPLHVIDLNFPF